MVLANKQKQLDSLYSQARQLFEAEEWQAVINIFMQMTTIAPDSPDPDKLLSVAKDKVEIQRQKKELYNL